MTQQMMRCKEKLQDLDELQSGSICTMFHIKTNMGYKIVDPLKQLNSMIVMKAGSYFLITHVDLQEEEGVQHIYMRQIEIGFSRNAAMWLDDN